MKQNQLKAIVIVDRRENSWFLNGGLKASIACHQIELTGLSVNSEDFHGTLRMIAEQSPDVVLLESTLERNFASSIINQVREKMPLLPVVLLPDIFGSFDHSAMLSDTGASQASLGPATANGQMAADTIAQIIRYVEGQHGLQRRLLQLALRDDLTGLHNRRGFTALANRYLSWARDSGQHLTMFFADLDGLKSINDRFGHVEGDRAILLAAARIKETFRKFDVTARLSGDEFVALIVEAPGRSADAIRRRLQLNRAICSGTEGLYSLSLSVGVAHFDPDKPVNLQELLRQADAALYQQKRNARQLSARPAVTNSVVSPLAGVAVMPPALA
jgi:two-component system cell cycle response regulator